MVRVDITQGVFDGQGLVRLGELGLSSGGAAIAGIHFGVFREFIIKLDGHGFICQIHGVDLLPF